MVTAPAVSPGDSDYRPAEAPFRPGIHEAPTHDAEGIVGALNVVAARGLEQAVLHGATPRCVLAAWQARDRGEDPEVPPDEALERLRYAVASLPDDLRCELAARAERAAWAYLAPDVEHERALEARRAEQAERERAEEEDRDRERREALDLGLRELGERLARDRAEAEEAERHREQAEQARREAAERARRQSEELRREEAA